MTNTKAAKPAVGKGAMRKPTRADEDKPITRTEMRVALRRSGYLIESRLFEELEFEREYIVVPNAAYRDPTTGKARELDIYAATHSLVMDSTYRSDGKPRVLVLATLLIECVNNPNPIALFRTRALSERYGETIRCVGVPANISDGGRRVGTPIFLQADEFHHYAHVDAASQFCSFDRKKADKAWMATHPDDQFESFAKLTDALEDRITRDVLDDA